MSAGWGELLRGGNAARCAVVGGGMIIHAINTFIVVTILPTVVRDIGGLPFFAWATTLYVVAALRGGSGCARHLAAQGPRRSYRLALGVFAAGTVVCALAWAMPVLLLGRLVQGLGAGTLSALAFSMVRVLFPQPLWPRALSVISAAWGVATLGGPAVGGVFAQYDAWRAAFWSVLLMVPLLLWLVERSLPRDIARQTRPVGSMAWLNLLLLVAAVLSVSLGGMAASAAASAAGLGCAILCFALFLRLERRSASRLLPHGACNPRLPLGATYAAMVLVLVNINVEIFVPYFLQALHFMRPIHAGYLSAVMSAGWTTGSVLSAGVRPGLARWGLAAGPATMLGGLALLLLVMPVPSGAPAALAAIGLGMAAMGLGIGMAWPHLGARILAFAPEGERDVAAASITITIMVTNAFGSALAGMITNLGGLGTKQGDMRAATWLFAAFLLPPLLGSLMGGRLARIPMPSETRS